MYQSLCINSFKASIYNIPESAHERLEMATGIMKSLADIELVNICNVVCKIFNFIGYMFVIFVLIQL